LGSRAGVADVGYGERHDLPRVGRVGEDLLIARDGSVENDLARGIASGSDRLAAEDRAIRQRQHRGCTHVLCTPAEIYRPARWCAPARYTKREEFSRTSSRL